MAGDDSPAGTGAAGSAGFTPTGHSTASGARGSVGKLGRFLLLGALPSGTNARFLARRAGREGFLVVKCLPKARAKDGAALAQLLEEARVASLLRHPNLTRLVEAGIEAGVFCISSEYTPGFSLRELTDHLAGLGRSFPPLIAVAVARGVLEALDYAHGLSDEAGAPLDLVHGNPNPQTVWISFQGEVRLGDFGAVLIPEDPGALPLLAYLAPEQVRTRGVATPKSDVYAVGIMLFEMLTGRALIPRGKPLDETLRAVAEGLVPALAEFAPHLSPVLSSAVEQALSRDVAMRFATAKAFREALDRVSPRAHDDPAGIAAFLSEVLPDAERALKTALEAYKRADPTTSTIAASAERIPSTERTALVARRRRTPGDSSDFVELSDSGESGGGQAGRPSNPGTAVLDMPGEAVPPGRTSIDWLMRRDRRPYSLVVLLFGVVIGLLVAILLSGRPTPATILDGSPVAVPQTPAIRIQAERAVARSDAEAELAEPAPRAMEAPDAEPDRDPGNRVRPRRRSSPNHSADERPSAGGPSTGVASVGRRPTESPSTGGPPTESAPAPSASADESSPLATARELRPLRAALTRLRASSKQDARAYLDLRDAIERSSADLPSSARARIRSDLNAADLTYNLDALERAIVELEDASGTPRKAR